jgi:hypothetical protein
MLNLSFCFPIDGASYEMAEGYVVEFKAQRTEITEERPHGISYAPCPIRPGQSANS